MADNLPSTSAKSTPKIKSKPWIRAYPFQPEIDPGQERRRDWVRAAFLGLLALLFTAVIAFACYANQFGDWPKAKELLAILLPALTGLIGAGTAFYFKNPSV